MYELTELCELYGDAWEKKMGMNNLKLRFKGKSIGKFPLIESTVKPKEKFQVIKPEEKLKNNFDPTQSTEWITSMKLKELAQKDIAILVHSEILDSKIWLCSNQGIEKQVKLDDPSAITYTVNEIIELIKLNPNPDELKRLHNAKEVFGDSKIIDSILKNEN